MLPPGLFDRLRAQMLLLLAGGILAVDVFVLIGVHQIQEREVEQSLDRAAARIQGLPENLPPVTVGLVDALAPSDLYLAYVGEDDLVLTASAPTSSDDLPDLRPLLADDRLRADEPTSHDAPGGTTYELIEVPVDRLTEIRLRDGPATTPVASVVIGYPKTTMEQTVQRLVLILGGSGVAVLIAALMFSRSFVRAGLRPLHRIGRTAEAIATGRTGERVAVDESDVELRDVGHALNKAFDTRQESEDRMRDFVADASHELRTPLASVRGWTDLYQQGGLSDWDGIDAAMRNIYQEAGRMEVLIEDMLMLARYDATPGAAPTEPVPVSTLLAELVESVARLHPDHTFALEPVDATLRAVADPESLRRAVSNLLVNAGGHTPPGTRVVVTATATPTQVEVRVTDDGPGLTAAERESAFDRFWRGDRSRGRRTEERGGTGLGLAICRSILRAVGGDLRLEAADPRGLAAVVVLRRV